MTRVKRSTHLLAAALRDNEEGDAFEQNNLRQVRVTTLQQHASIPTTHETAGAARQAVAAAAEGSRSSRVCTMQVSHVTRVCDASVTCHLVSCARLGEALQLPLKLVHVGDEGVHDLAPRLVAVAGGGHMSQ